jgi:hypothetical protein
MSLQIVNPLQIPNWDDLVLAAEKGSFFHSSAWARVLNESYGYKPIYFTVIANDRLSWLMPFMEVNSFLTGKRGVSLPFTDFCDSFAPNVASFLQAVEEVKKYGMRNGWKSIEWRGNSDYFENVTPSAAFFSHTLQLTGSEKEIFSRFKSNTRRNINKAVKEGVRVETGDSLEFVKAYYRLHCVTRRDHGLPPQPFSFFKKIFEHVIAAGKGFVALGFIGHKCIAGAIYFGFGKKAMYKFGASDKHYQNSRPNNLIMWEAIRECARRGFQEFSFGRTETDNEGLLQFKRGWGTREELASYYKFDLAKNSFVAENLGVKGSYNHIFGIAPIPVLRFMGAAMYRHFG